MANSVDADGIYRNVSEPVNIPKRVSPTGSVISEKEQMEVLETENSLSDLESSPGTVLSSHEPMDVDSDIAVAEYWARSMDETGTDPSDFQSHTYDREGSTAERQANAHEDHMPRQYIMESRDSWRPRGEVEGTQVGSLEIEGLKVGSLEIEGLKIGSLEILEIKILESASLDINNLEVEEEPIDIHNVLYHEAQQFGTHRQGMIIMT
ncbi:hypothetical protein ACLOAV_010239 [Pseudogymnoascus australis]